MTNISLLQNPVIKKHSQRILVYLFMLLCAWGVVKYQTPDMNAQVLNAQFKQAGQAVGDKNIEVGFSPKEGALDLVLKVINSAKTTLNVSAYSFTSPEVVSALVAAKKRGVEVKIIADYKGNQSAASKSALNTCKTAGIGVRLISSYAIHHDKIIIADGQTVETGSFNYSKAADKSNSENVIVLWNQPTIAEIYQKHFESRFTQGTEYVTPY